MRIAGFCGGGAVIALGCWLCVASLLAPGAGGGGPGAARAAAAASIGLVDGTLWARAAEAQAARLAEPGLSPGDRAEARARMEALLRRALSLAPLQPRLWLLLAQAENGRAAAVEPQARALEMSYATGAGRVALAGPRLRLAARLPGLGSRTIQDFALGDVALLLSASPDGRNTMLAIYDEAAGGNRPFLHDAVASRDPALAKRLPERP